MKREMMAWRKHGTRLQRKYPDEFRRALEEEGWVAKRRAPETVDEEIQPRLGLEETDKQAPKKGDNAYKKVGKSFEVRGRMLSIVKNRAVVEDDKGVLNKVSVKGETTFLEEAQAQVVMKVHLTVPCTGSNQKKKLVSDADEVQIMPPSEE